MIRLLVVEDHELFREGLRGVFECVDDIEIGAEAASGEAALIALENERFDLVLLDLSLRGISGVELISKIRARLSSPPILILSMHNEAQVAKRKLMAGASGYITKECSSKELFAAIRKVASGDRYITPELAEKIIFESGASAPFVPHELLSGRENLILRMMAKGKKVNSIAQELGISSKTVSTHKTRLMQKLHIDNMAKLIQYTIIHGLIE